MLSEAHTTDSVPLPIAMTIRDAVRWSGISRSEIYRRLKTRHLVAKKSGSRTLVLTDSIIDYIKQLPTLH